MVDLHATVLQHQLEIAIADREHQVPAHGPQDHLGRELPAFELFALPHDTRAAIRLVATARLSNPDPPHKLATEPRPHQGISQDKLPLYLGFFQLVHNARRRGRAPLRALIAGLVA